MSNDGERVQLGVIVSERTFEAFRADGRKSLLTVKLIVEIIEPFHGRIYDSARGSRGALRAIKRIARLNLSFTPEDMLKSLSQRATLGRGSGGSSK